MRLTITDTTTTIRKIGAKINTRTESPAQPCVSMLSEKTVRGNPMIGAATYIVNNKIILVTIKPINNDNTIPHFARL